ncbi:MAG: chorismate-binding protein [Acidobacteriota bacterium]
MLERAEAATRAGRWAAGFLAYEAAPAFDDALAVHPPREGLPLAWWAIFDRPPRRLPSLTRSADDAPSLAWRRSLSAPTYQRAVDSIRRRIARGEVYQVNFTYAFEALFSSDRDASLLDGGALDDFAASLIAAQDGGRHGAVLDLGRIAIVSASPELLIDRRDDRVTTRPLKGTAPRGRWPEEDAREARALGSAKNRAENLMILDMARNDLGRVAVPGTVQVTRLFARERYPTVHQLASTVEARLPREISTVDLVAAVFPAASITGAPKVAATRAIRQLESDPRGIYTGSIGWLAPGGRARLSVAIRTAEIDRQRGRVRYGTGGGIVWDSTASAEWAESGVKTRILRAAPRRDFDLFETILWRPRHGYFLLERHMLRLRRSAHFFNRPFDVAEARERLQAAAAGFAGARRRVRLTARCDGDLAIDHRPIEARGDAVWTVTLDDRSIDERDLRIFHKTSDRTPYRRAVERHPEADDVLLWNARGQLTEATRANLVVRRGNAWITPPIACGLLAGTYREELLDRGVLCEDIVRRDELQHADAVFLVNSLRGWIRVRLAQTDQGATLTERVIEPARARPVATAADRRRGERI